MRTGTMLAIDAQVQAPLRTMWLALADGHGSVEIVDKDPYCLIEKNRNNEVSVPRDFLPPLTGLGDITSCHIVAWCDSMAWKAGDMGPAFILMTVAGGKAFAIRPAVMSRLLEDKQVEAETLNADSSDEGFEVAQLGGGAEDEDEGEEDEEGEVEGQEEQPPEGSQPQVIAVARGPEAAFAAPIMERITALHGTTATAKAKAVELLEGVGKGCNRRYKPGCTPKGWDATAGDFNKAYTDNVPKSARERPSNEGLQLKEGKGVFYCK